MAISPLKKAVESHIRRLPNKQDGTAIILSGKLMEALTALVIVCCSILPVTDRFTAEVYTLRNRVRRRAFEWLERLEGKLSRAVLRGRETRNGLLLPDLNRGLLIAEYLCWVNSRCLKGRNNGSNLRKKVR